MSTTAYINLETILCCNCGVPFGMTDDYQQRRRADHATFYCPAGHPQSYHGKSAEEKLREQLAEKERALTAAKCAEMNERNAREKVERKMRRQCRRVHAGVCPCCNRTFKQLAAHMAQKHPDFVPSTTLAK